MRKLYLRNFLAKMVTHPKDMLRSLLRSPLMIRGLSYTRDLDLGEEKPGDRLGLVASRSNPLRDYFENHQTGRGIWKWDHYFDIYHRYFGQFVGRDVKILEIGIFSGGSLELWRHYLGERATIYGVDMEEACLCYANEFTKILIGDQGNRCFLRSVVDELKSIDIVVDDGSHIPEHQIAAFEEIFPFVRPGGVFVCEDVHGIHNEFLDYVHGLTKAMCAMSITKDKRTIPSTSIQRWTKSIHVYPYIVVIEKSEAPADELINRRAGTEWQPWTAKGKSNVPKLL